MTQRIPRNLILLQLLAIRVLLKVQQAQRHVDLRTEDLVFAELLELLLQPCENLLVLREPPSHGAILESRIEHLSEQGLLVVVLHIKREVGHDLSPLVLKQRRRPVIQLLLWRFMSIVFHLIICVSQELDFQLVPLRQLLRLELLELLVQLGAPILQLIVLLKHLFMLLDQLLVALSRPARRELLEDAGVNGELAHDVWLLDELDKELVKVLVESQMLDLVEVFVFLDSGEAVELFLLDLLVEVLHPGSHFDVGINQLLHIHLLGLAIPEQLDHLQVLLTGHPLTLNLVHNLLLNLASQRLLLSPSHHVVQELVDRLIVVSEQTPVEEPRDLGLRHKVAHLAEHLEVLVFELFVLHGVLLDRDRLIPLFDLLKVYGRDLMGPGHLILNPLLSFQQDLGVILHSGRVLLRSQVLVVDAFVELVSLELEGFVVLGVFLKHAEGGLRLVVLNEGLDLAQREDGRLGLGLVLTVDQSLKEVGLAVGRDEAEEGL